MKKSGGITVNLILRLIEEDLTVWNILMFFWVREVYRQLPAVAVIS